MNAETIEVNAYQAQVGAEEELSDLLSVELKITKLEAGKFDNLDAWLPKTTLIEKYKAQIIDKLIVVA